MSLVGYTGGFNSLLGLAPHFGGLNPATTNNITIDATNEALILVGQVFTADGGSHTIDTTGSSALHWLSAAVTFANAGTTVKVGLAAVDTAAGPPPRAVNVTEVITFDVAASFTGGGGGITGSAWQTSVPTTGTKTIANGDFVAFAVQMTARGGSDSIVITGANNGFPLHRPTITTLVSTATYTESSQGPNVLIVFSDGTLGWFYMSDVRSAVGTRTWNSGSSPNEYGQLFNMPFPYRVYGMYGWLDPDADCDVVFYSDPLGTPVAEKTLSIDANTVSQAIGRRIYVMFPAAYDVPANTPVAVVFKPGGSNVSAYYKTLASATHRVTDAGGTSSYGVSRSSGAFANANSSLDHYYMGLLVGGFEHGVQPNFVLGI